VGRPPQLQGLEAFLRARGARARTRLDRMRDAIARSAPVVAFRRIDPRLWVLLGAALLVGAVATMNTFWLLVSMAVGVAALLSRGMKPLNLLAVLVAFACVPFFTDDFTTFTFFTIGMYILLGIGLNVVVGFAGLLDLGYVAFFATGAYVTAFLASPFYDLSLTYYVIIPAAMVCAAVAGTILGIPVLRLRGDYLAIVTLGFGEIIRLLVNNLDDLTNGPQGLFPIDDPKLFGVTFNDNTHYYFLILAGCIICGFVTERLRLSRIGRAWEAIREDEEVAAGMGIDLVRYKLLAFAIGASFGGLGGVAFAASQGAIFPPDFALQVSINVLALVIIGGMGSIPGVVVGALILVGAPEGLRDLPAGLQGLEEYRLVIYGALLVLVMLLRPGGIIPSSRRRLEFQVARADAVAESRGDSRAPA